MRKIGKISALLFTALFAVLISMPMVEPAQAWIEQYIWIPPYAYKGYDYYYGTSIIAYLNGTTVNVKIQVDNDAYSPYINVTVVSMVFDWGLNKTLDKTAAPVKINYGETSYFDISFTADISQASNAWAHTYTTYVNFTYDSWKWQWTRSYDYKFVVFSQEQKDVRDLSTKYWAYEDAYPPYSFQTTKGRLLATQAAVEASQAQTSSNIGNFTEAKTHFQTAIDLYDQAFDIEEEKGVAMDEAELNATIKGADAAVKEADAAMLQAQASMNQAYGYILLGLGFVLVGIGAIVYGFRKPKPTQS